MSQFLIALASLTHIAPSLATLCSKVLLLHQQLKMDERSVDKYAINDAKRELCTAIHDANSTLGINYVRCLLL